MDMDARQIMSDYFVINKKPLSHAAAMCRHLRASSCARDTSDSAHEKYHKMQLSEAA